MADSFYFGNDMQDLLLACMLTYRSEFHVLGSLVQPEFMWGASATRIMHGIQDYHTKEGLFPGFTALDGFLLEQFSRDKADIYKDCHDYLEDLKELDTTDWKWVKSVTIKFCRERSLIVAIKKAADLVKTDKIPDGGFTKMFDEAMAVGGVLEPSRTLSQVAQQPSDPNNNVLGDRYGFQGGSLLLVGATGIGKSALSYQLAICGGLCIPFFGIPFKCSTRTLILQNENDDEDVLDGVAGVVNGLSLSDEQCNLVLDGIRIKMVDTVGDEFLAELETRLRSETKPGHLVIIDPLLAFFGGDLKLGKDISKWIRQGVFRLARKYKVLLVLIHHINKPATQKNQVIDLKGSDLSYLGAGGAELFNAVRATIAVQSTGTYDTFKLSLGKRSGHADFIDANGNKAKSIFIRHSQEGIYWELVKGEEQARLQGTDDKQSVVLNLVGEGETSHDLIIYEASKRNVGRDTCIGLLNLLVEQHKIVAKGGKGHTKKTYSRVAGVETLDPEDQPAMPPMRRPGRKV